MVVANGAGRSAPERVLGVAQELAHRDVAIGPSLTHAAPGAKGVGKGAGPEAGGRRRDAEAGQFEGSALAFQEVARCGEGRVLIADHRRYALKSGGVVDSCGSTNQVRRRGPIPEARQRAGNLVVGVGCGRGARAGATHSGASPAGHQRNQIMGVFAAGTEANDWAHGVRRGIHAEHVPEHGADRLADAPQEGKEREIRVRTTRTEVIGAGIISEIGTCQ